MSSNVSIRRRSAAQRRAGFTLHEAMMATALALAGLAAAAQLLGMVAGQRRLGQQRTVAVHEAGNLMEQLAGRPWNALSDEKLASIELSEACRRGLPGAALRVHVTNEDPGTRRISIQIDWQSPVGRQAQPVQLVGWRFRDAEGQP